MRTHGTGTKHFHHHIVGELALVYESLDLRAEPGLMLTIYAAEPDSPTAHALALLASWAATHLPRPGFSGGEVLAFAGWSGVVGADATTRAPALPPRIGRADRSWAARAIVPGHRRRLALAAR